ncbi:MAG TPA: hypothetical protein VFH73_07080 [Polyangia bacterium]|jgi:plastocyanin|nr:hypothetical protein [Polyangia bacterium]
METLTALTTTNWPREKRMRMFRSHLRIGLLCSLVPFAVLVGCGGSGSNPDARKDAKPDVPTTAGTGGTAGGGTGGGTGGAGTGGADDAGAGGSGGSGGASMDAPQDVPRDVPTVDVPRDIVTDVPPTDARDGGANQIDAATDTGADAGADTAAETAAETANDTPAETAHETAPEAAEDTAHETAPETANDTGNDDTGTAFVSIAPCTAASDYTTSDTSIIFRNGANGYDPPCVKIAKGGSVMFSGAFGTHPLEPRTATGGSPNNPITFMNTGTTHTIAFPNAGFFPFHCNIHSDMIGVIQVTE